MKEITIPEACPVLFGLYIPHGSDEREQCLLCLIPLFLLYIPHGSDESALCSFTTIPLSSFISHMVQMKAEACCAFSSKYSLYIPHGSDES